MGSVAIVFCVPSKDRSCSPQWVKTDYFMKNHRRYNSSRLLGSLTNKFNKMSCVNLISPFFVELNTDYSSTAKHGFLSYGLCKESSSLQHRSMDSTCSGTLCDVQMITHSWLHATRSSAIISDTRPCRPTSLINFSTLKSWEEPVATTVSLSWCPTVLMTYCLAVLYTVLLSYSLTVRVTMSVTLS